MACIFARYNQPDYDHVQHLRTIQDCFRTKPISNYNSERPFVMDEYNEYNEYNEYEEFLEFSDGEDCLLPNEEQAIMDVYEIEATPLDWQGGGPDLEGTL